MPKIKYMLTDEEVRMACRAWIEAGSPRCDTKGVLLFTLPGSDDPREPHGPQVTASVQVFN